MANIGEPIKHRRVIPLVLPQDDPHREEPAQPARLPEKEKEPVR